MTQTEARAACRANYTDLVTVCSEEDNTALINLTKTYSKVWIGLQRDETDLTFSSHLITQSLTWYEAQTYCRKNYTDLVSIRDQDQNEAVKIKGGNISMSFWIGLLRDDWEWTDGGHSAYMSVNVSLESPLDYCKKENISPVFSPAQQGCLRTFHLIGMNMTQTEARAACRANYTDLVTVYDVEDITALINLTGIGSAWTGLYRNPVQSSTKWSNGDEVTFSALSGDCGSGPCCAAMKADGSWESLLCSVKRNFMCYKQDETDLTFSYHLILQSLTWYEAQTYCRRNYTDLVSIRDQDQNEAVKIKGMNSTTPFWIGLLRDDWEWAAGGRSAYRNWWDGQPGPFPSNCVKLVSGKLYSVPCSNTGPALCYSSKS
ncbi:macrophage mannose receptor 1-like [Salminus brasiliensis]|uniref:macrophage mannose receptor 1-like n=1 Tax=Salminus brasiliensis TaxID=930266 RepID=UPI003B82EDA6